MMLWKCCTQYASKFGNSAVATGLISFHWKDQLSFQTQRRAIPNCVQKTVQLHSFHALARRRQWQPTPALLPGKSHGQKGLVCCSPWGCEESDMTEWLQFHFSYPCIGEGNDNQLQYSCHLFIKSPASLRSIPFLSFIAPIFAWNVPLVSQIVMKRSLVFSVLLFSSISLCWSLRKA